MSHEARGQSEREAEARARLEREERRADRQRQLMAIVPNSAALTRLKKAMLQRAYDLLWDGQGEACDALTEFLPSADVIRMLNAWSDDQEGREPKSEWYENYG